MVCEYIGGTLFEAGYERRIGNLKVVGRRVLKIDGVRVTSAAYCAARIAAWKRVGHIMAERV